METKDQNDRPTLERPVSGLSRLGLGFELLIQKCGAGFAIFTSLAIVIMMLMGGADVVGTKLFNQPVPATLELTETLMVALVFGGLAFAQAKGRHVRVELMIRRLSPRVRAAMNLLAVLIGSAFFALMTWKCAWYFWQSWLIKEFDTGLYQFPIYPAKFLMLVGAGLMTVQLVIDLFRAVRNVSRRNSQ